MFSKTTLIAGAMLAASVSGASATTYQIAISGSCDTLTLTNSNGIVVGVSNAPSCDDSNLIGYKAKVKNGIASPGAVLIASGSLGDPAYTWTWALNLKTLQATLTGTEDGVTFIQGNFPFTFTHGGDRARTGLPSAVVTTLTAARH